MISRKRAPGAGPGKMGDSKHHFWQTNILSPESLRKQWDKLTMQRNAGGEQRAVKPDLDFNNTDWAYGVIR